MVELSRPALSRLMLRPFSVPIYSRLQRPGSYHFMLHLVFCDNGLDRLKDVLRPSDQVVQLSHDQILLVDTGKYLDLVLGGVYRPLQNKELAPRISKPINQRELAAIISEAHAIKSTY